MESRTQCVSDQKGFEKQSQSLFISSPSDLASRFLLSPLLPTPFHTHLCSSKTWHGTAPLLGKAFLHEPISMLHARSLSEAALFEGRISRNGGRGSGGMDQVENHLDSQLILKPQRSVCRTGEFHSHWESSLIGRWPIETNTTPCCMYNIYTLT